MNTNTRLSPEVRRRQILEAAVTLAEETHYTQVTRQGVATEARIAPTLISYHFSTMPQLRRAIMRYAVHNEHLVVIAQGLVARDPQALKAASELQARALGSLL